MQTFTRNALYVHAVVATGAAIAFGLGLAPHSTESAALAHRFVAAHVAAAVLFVVVARRLASDARLIVAPLAFVACSFLTSIYDLAKSRDPNDAGGLVPETVFLAIYVAFFVKNR